MWSISKSIFVQRKTNDEDGDDVGDEDDDDDDDDDDVGDNDDDDDYDDSQCLVGNTLTRHAGTTY